MAKASKKNESVQSTEIVISVQERLNALKAFAAAVHELTDWRLADQDATDMDRWYWYGVHRQAEDAMDHVRSIEDALDGAQLKMEVKVPDAA